MAERGLRIKIYGVRGSYSPTKMTNTNIGVNTTCIYAEISDLNLIFDAGSGVINCGKEIIQRYSAQQKQALAKKTHLFFTHLHIDHLNGLPYFPMLYIPQSEIHCFSPKILDHSLPDVVQQMVNPPYFPVCYHELPCKFIFNEIKEFNTLYFNDDGYVIKSVPEFHDSKWKIKISCMRNLTHPKGGGFFYKLETNSGIKIVLATDTEGFVGGDQRLINFAKDADLLVHDAHYTPEEYPKFQGFGHSTYEMACGIAQKAGVKTLVLTHHDPDRTDAQLFDIEEKARKLFPATKLAAENMILEF